MRKEEMQINLFQLLPEHWFRYSVLTETASPQPHCGPIWAAGTTSQIVWPEHRPETLEWEHDPQLLKTWEGEHCFCITWLGAAAGFPVTHTAHASHCNPREWTDGDIAHTTLIRHKTLFKKLMWVHTKPGLCHYINWSKEEMFCCICKRMFIHPSGSHGWLLHVHYDNLFWDAQEGRPTRRTCRQRTERAGPVYESKFSFTRSSCLG